MTTAARIAPLAAVLCLVATHAWAADGVLLVETRTANGATQTTQIQIEKTRMRAEVPGAQGAVQTVVFDGAAQVMRMIDTANKSYVEISKADVDQLSDQMSGAMAMMQERMKSLPPEQRAQMEAAMRGRGMPGAAGAPAAAKTEYKKTGTGKVGKWTCDKYDGFQGDKKVSEICTVEPSALGVSAGDFDVTKQMASFFQKIVPQSSGQMFSIGSAELGFSGIPVRSVIGIGGGRETTIEITEVSRKNFTDASYAVPDGFQKRASPFAGRGRGRQQ